MTSSSVRACTPLTILATALCLPLAAGCREAPTAPPAPPSAPSAPSPPPSPPAGFTVAGTVRAATTGEPLSGVSVYQVFGGKGSPSTVTDSAGRYRISLTRSEKLRAQKSGYVPVDTDKPVTAGGTYDFELRPGVRIGGRTEERGVGTLGGVRVEILSGPDAGVETTSTSWGSYSLPYVAPGVFRIRASKDGFDRVEVDVDTAITTSVNFTMQWAYGDCLSSVTPVLFDMLPPGGASGTIRVEARAERDWSAAAAAPWFEVIGRTTRTGSGTVSFEVRPSAGEVDERRDAIRIRCENGGGQDVTLVQLPDCGLQLLPEADTPAEFTADGGTGRLQVITSTPGCFWRAASRADWIRGVGIQSWRGTNTVAFVVEANTTGRSREGIFQVSEKTWVVRQR